MKKSIILLAVAALVINSGCKKFLDEKRNKSTVVPASLKDCQALLDNYLVMNEKDASAGEVSADDYYLRPAEFAAQPENYRRLYTWQREGIYPTSGNTDWSFLYQTVHYANVVLETLEQITRTEQNAVQWDDIKGQALVFRSRSFMQAALIWARPYDANTATASPGIPLRLTTNFNERTNRGTVSQTYERILADFTEAANLLPKNTIATTRPSKTAAFALLARTYLAMREFEKAGVFADSALRLNSSLLNYNQLNPNAAFPFAPGNAEIIFEAAATNNLPLFSIYSAIDSTVYQSYHPNDLRRVLFFSRNSDNTYSFKGGYRGDLTVFSGITTPEMYLIKAETLARAGKAAEAMEALNTLLKSRWKTGTFQPITAASATEALNIVLQERRKELLMRHLRWFDLRRLVAEGRNITPRRMVSGTVYTLPPQLNKYVLPIPDQVIKLSGIEQNPD